MNNNNWKQEFESKLTTPKEAVQLIKDGDTVYAGTCTSVAYSLCDALGERADELNDVRLTCSQILYPVRIMSGKDKAFKIYSYFVGAQERTARANGGFIDFTSVHLSQSPVFCRETAPANVALFEVSEPDSEGYMSYGASGVALHSYVKETANIILVEVNPNVPYVFGIDNKIHVSEVTAIVKGNRPIFEKENMDFDDTIKRISDYVLDQIPDGACIQLGIGGVANAVGFGLKKKNDLSAHTELVTDSVMELMMEGNITNEKKGFLPGKTTAAFSLGTRKLYEYMDHNEKFCYMPFHIINDPVNIAKNDNMISINTAMSVDIFGQVCADNIAGRQYSGTGGQLDFVKGAQMSKGGKSFIAIASTFSDRNGKRHSRIVSRLPFGAAVTTPRSEVQYIVTEYGCINLKPLTMRQRADAMINLAHPDYRQKLRSEVEESGIFA